jgi:hypothetical protein
MPWNATQQNLDALAIKFVAKASRLMESKLSNQWFFYPPCPDAPEWLEPTDSVD